MQHFIIQNLITILESIPQIKEVRGPLFDGTLTKFPAIVFQQDNFTNEFDGDENHKTFTFQMWLGIPANNKSLEEIGRDLMPKVADIVVKKFDDTWNGGTYQGHRVWHRLSTGLNSLTLDDKNKTAYLQMTLVVRLNTNVV
jgi:hypothetical protein